MEINLMSLLNIKVTCTYNGKLFLFKARDRESDRLCRVVEVNVDSDRHCCLLFLAILSF